MSSGVEVKKNGRILEVCLNKPKVNAINVEMSQELGKAFAELRDDKDLWVGILTCLLYTSPSPRDSTLSRMPSSA